jgi:Cysteine-rich CPCC
MSKEEFLECPCCGQKTLEERFVFDYCAVCFWEDDWDQSEDSSNHTSLEEAKRNYAAYGACDEHARQFVITAEQWQLAVDMELTRDPMMAEKVRTILPKIEGNMRILDQEDTVTVHFSRVEFQQLIALAQHGLEKLTECVPAVQRLSYEVLLVQLLKANID